MRMKRNWKAAGLTLLAMMTIVTSALYAGTLARYTAVASASASARVAKFSITINNGMTDGSVGYFYHGKSMNGATSSTAGGVARTGYSTASKTRTFTVTNNSEVALRVTPRASAAASRISFSPTYVDLAPNATSGNITMTITTPLTGTNGAANFYTVQVICNAVQID